ncbi:hypothetical protein CTZ27_10665 [Streptomyces griseocarneus]|nr:hypothetical protein CTZ27_10665 [Streptomyces griseocarneus]
MARRQVRAHGARGGGLAALVPGALGAARREQGRQRAALSGPPAFPAGRGVRLSRVLPGAVPPGRAAPHGRGAPSFRRAGRRPADPRHRRGPGVRAAGALPGRARSGRALPPPPQPAAVREPRVTGARPRVALVLRGEAHQNGGVGTSVLRLARGLAADGRFAVDVVALRPLTPAPPGADPVPDEPCGTDGGVCFFDLCPAATTPSGADSELAVQLALVALARRRGYALLHGFYASSAGYHAAWAAAECGVPSVVGIRGNDIYGNVFDHSRLTRLQWALSRAGRIVAVSSEAARRADILAGCGPRTTVVLNSIDPSAYRDGTVPVPGDPVVGTLGLLRAKKGVDLLVRAFPAVLERYPEARLVLAGEIREDVASLPDLAASSGIAHRTVFTGPLPREDALRHLRGMDVFVLPSLHEGCPNAVLEAMVAGTPVVASAVGAVPEMVVDGEEAVLVRRPGSWRAVADGVLTMLAADRKSVAERAGQAVRTRFALAREVEQNVAVYRDCLGRG